MNEPGGRDDTNEVARGVMPRGALGAWWWQGTRTAWLMKPDWSGLQATPAVVACLFVVPVLLSIGLERLYIHGPARFYWPGLTTGWISTVLTAWTCWMLSRQHERRDSPSPDAASLFAMLSAQGLTLVMAAAIVFVPMVRSGLGMAVEGPAVWVARVAWIGILGWYFVAQAVLLWRAAPPRPGPRAAAVTVVAVVLALQQWAPTTHWYPAAPARDAADGEQEPYLRLTQDKIEQQATVLPQRLQALAAQRPGVIDVYALTYAPYEQDVFRRESEVVADVMTARFDARDRTLQLVNHPATLATAPWATPLNLQRAIRRVAELMDKDEDVLFIHLTSHGARDGQLSSSFWPLQVDTLTPQQLKTWLDEAGVRHRIVSVSACYSGSWIEPLADADTLIMTAADAEHTSYGCGSRSELTFFGRAMYDENLRATWSFEQAHARARTVIERREQEAGKRDGYSNPQIRVGARIGDTLHALESQLSMRAH